MNNALRVFGYLVIYLAIISYFEEYILARHIFFKSQCIIGKIVDFGKSQKYYHSKAAREFYTVVEYVKNGEIHTSKICRNIGDEVGKQVVLAVQKENKWCVRYERGKGYNEYAGEFSMLAFCIFLLISLLAIDITTGKLEEIFRLFGGIIVLHYLFLPGFIQFRNDMWKLN